MYFLLTAGAAIFAPVYRPTRSCKQPSYDNDDDDKNGATRMEEEADDTRTTMGVCGDHPPPPIIAILKQYFTVPLHCIEDNAASAATAAEVNLLFLVSVLPHIAKYRIVCSP